MGSYVRVLAVLGLENDIHGLARDDKVGRKLQDLALEPHLAPARRKRTTDERPEPAAPSPAPNLEKPS